MEKLVEDREARQVEIVHVQYVDRKSKGKKAAASGRAHALPVQREWARSDGESVLSPPHHVSPSLSASLSPAPDPSACPPRHTPTSGEVRSILRYARGADGRLRWPHEVALPKAVRFRGR